MHIFQIFSLLPGASRQVTGPAKGPWPVIDGVLLDPASYGTGTGCVGCAGQRFLRRTLDTWQKWGKKGGSMGFPRQNWGIWQDLTVKLYGGWPFGEKISTKKKQPTLVYNGLGFLFQTCCSLMFFVCSYFGEGPQRLIPRRGATALNLPSFSINFSRPKLFKMGIWPSKHGKNGKIIDWLLQNASNMWKQHIRFKIDDPQFCDSGWALKSPRRLVRSLDRSLPRSLGGFLQRVSWETEWGIRVLFSRGKSHDYGVMAQSF